MADLRAAAEGLSEQLTRLIAVVLALVFGAASLGAQWLWWQGASQALAARDWVAQPAELLDWSLDARGATSMVVDPRAEAARRLQARFRYRAAGQERIGTEVFVAPLVDTVSDMDRDRAIDLLRAAQDRGGQIALWRDPERPDRTVLVRELPGAFAAGLIVFMVFPCGPFTATLLGWLMRALARLGWTGAPAWTGRLWCLWHAGLAAASLGLIAPWARGTLAGWLLVGLLLALAWSPARALWALRRPRAGVPAVLLSALLVLGGSGAPVGPAQAASPAQTWQYDLVSESSGLRLGGLVLALEAASGERTLTAGYGYKDNGRGPETQERMRLAADGSLLAYTVQGTSTFGSAIDEHFERADGRARWRSPVDRGDQPLSGPALYAAMGGSPALDAVALTALAQRPDRALPLLPSGRLSQHVLARAVVEHGGVRLPLQLLAHTGLGLSPNYLWATDESSPRLFAVVWAGWGALVQTGWDAVLPRLRALQGEAEVTLHRQRAAEWLQPLPGLTVVRNARVFDSAAARLGPACDVYVLRGRITAVLPAGSAVPADVDTEIDAAGRVMLPGLFDMHDHAWRGSGGLHLAAGVTTVRDMGNANDQLQQLIDEQARGALAYPQIVPAGFLEGVSPFSSSNGILVRTLDEARAAVDWYARHGYTMVKIYNSFPRELLRETVDYAHQRGLRVGGHVPAFLRAEEVVDMGFDEVSHVNQLLLNFLVTPSTDTRTLERFYLPAERLGELDLDSAPVREFIARLRARGTVVDLTLMTFQFLQQRDGEVPAELAGVLQHLPPDMQRAALSAQMKIPDEATAQRYRAAVAQLSAFARRLHAAGITMVAGTDNLSGIVLHSEVIGYARAGLTPGEALRVATYNGARVSGTLADRGEILPGRRADLILVDGDPTQRIEDIRRVALVITQGALLRPRQVHEALGIRPFVEAAPPVVTRRTAAPAPG